MRPIIIAIDGPSGAGKGTLARRLASLLGYPHVDTGAMYRAVAWKAQHESLPLDDDLALSALAVRARIEQDGQGIRIDGHEVTRAIRTPAIDQAAAQVARLPGVRAVLVERQRALGAAGVVMEGRDIGTVVFPDADVKVYLDASAEERARRRMSDAEHSASGGGDVARVQDAMAARDRSDSTRPVAPLTLAPDAVYVDTTDLDADGVFAQVLALVRRTQNEPDSRPARS